MEKKDEQLTWNEGGQVDFVEEATATKAADNELQPEKTTKNSSKKGLIIGGCAVVAAFAAGGVTASLINSSPEKTSTESTAAVENASGTEAATVAVPYDTTVSSQMAEGVKIFENYLAELLPEAAAAYKSQDQFLEEFTREDTSQYLEDTINMDPEIYYIVDLDSDGLYPEMLMYSVSGTTVKITYNYIENGAVSQGVYETECEPADLKARLLLDECGSENCVALSTKDNECMVLKPGNDNKLEAEVEMQGNLREPDKTSSLVSRGTYTTYEELDPLKYGANLYRIRKYSLMSGAYVDTAIFSLQINREEFRNFFEVNPQIFSVTGTFPAYRVHYGETERVYVGQTLAADEAEDTSADELIRVKCSEITVLAIEYTENTPYYLVVTDAGEHYVIPTLSDDSGETIIVNGQKLWQLFVKEE